MTAPSPDARRDALLQAAADWTLEHGLADLSLRPLAKALGTSDRMLIYHFASKQGLVEAVIAENARRLSEELAAAEGARTVGRYVEHAWRVLAGERGRALAAFFLELHVLAKRRGEPYRGAALALGSAWAARTAERLRAAGAPPARARALAELLLTSIDGALLLDTLREGEPAPRLPPALKALVALLEPSPGR